MTTDNYRKQLLAIRREAFDDELTLLCHKYDLELVTIDVNDVHDYEVEYE